MPKTERDLMYAIADKIGGARGKRMREKLGKKMPFDHLLEKPLSDEEFATQLQRAEVEIRRFGRFSSLPPWFHAIEQLGEKPPTWGFPN
jgi:hypothetical protein